MKQLKLFPKVFIYTLALMLIITLLASGMIYLLAPILPSDNVLTEGIGRAGTSYDVTVIEDESGIAPASIPRNTAITNAVLSSLPYTISVCFIVSLVCAFLFSRAITKPIKHILYITTHMEELYETAACEVYSRDEIGMLSTGINALYQKLLLTIEHLREEKNRVADAEKQKVDFLRVASHELKTPVTSLNAMLDNMIMGVGKYKDYAIYLPLCKEQTEQLGAMISEILETSKLGEDIENEPAQAFDAAAHVSALSDPYKMIAQANGQQFKVKLEDCIPVSLPANMFSKALSNVLSNAVAYTEYGKTISVYAIGRELIVENECLPFPEAQLKHIFEPFYRPA